jgi:hypothetical protein
MPLGPAADGRFQTDFHQCKSRRTGRALPFCSDWTGPDSRTKESPMTDEEASSRIAAALEQIAALLKPISAEYLALERDRLDAAQRRLQAETAERDRRGII